MLTVEMQKTMFLLNLSVPMLISQLEVTCIYWPWSVVFHWYIPNAAHVLQVGAIARTC